MILTLFINSYLARWSDETQWVTFRKIAKRPLSRAFQVCQRAETIPMTGGSFAEVSQGCTPGFSTCPPAPLPWQAANHHGRFATTPRSRGGCFPARHTRLLGVPPTSDLAGRSGCYTLSADFHQPTSALRAWVGLRSFSPREVGAGLGHFSPGAGHVFAF